MTTTTRITHAEGVALCERYLRDEKRCVVTLTEPQAPGVSEICDAIGWPANMRAHVMDWKCSDSDAKAHGRKLFVQHAHLGVGRYRSIASEPHVVTTEYLPWYMGHYWYADGVWVERREPTPIGKWDYFAEMALLCQAMRNLERAGKSANDARRSSQNQLSPAMVQAVRMFLADNGRVTSKAIKRAVPEVSKRFKSAAALATALKGADGIAHEEVYGVAYFWLEEGA